MSASNAMLLKKNPTKSSTEKQSSAIIVHEAKRTATSARTTPTRQNKPFEAAAVQQRRCPQLSYSLAVSAAVRTWCGGETSTSNAMLLKKNPTKSSTEKKSSAIIVYNVKRTATSTRTTSTRHNKPYRLGAAPAGVVGTPSRRCPAATVPAAVVCACGFRCCFAEIAFFFFNSLLAITLLLLLELLENNTNAAAVAEIT